jgi:hypothetical protein
MTYPNGKVLNYNYAAGLDRKYAGLCVLCRPPRCQVGINVAHRRVRAGKSGTMSAKARDPEQRFERLAMNAVRCR